MERVKPKGNPSNGFSPPQHSVKPKTQFINITDSTSLDKASRTQVRVQAMRDYHRRRTENPGGGIEPKPISQKPLTAKAQTRKFRLGQEKMLQPWAPVKSSPSQRSFANRDSEIKTPTEIKANVESNQVHLRVSDRRHHSSPQGPGDRFPAEMSIDPWPSVSDFVLKTTNLYHSPGIGRLDPFSATSLIITPRAQLLIHHYCT